ncbi:alpha/beta hydrolase [Jatrophihabitans fulvus]
MQVDGRAPAPEPAAASAPRAFARRHPVWVSVPVVLLGTVVTALGAGVAVRHLAKDGLRAGVVGVLVLAAGVAVLAFAWHTLWRALRRWRRLWLVPGSLVVLLLAFSMAQGVALSWAPRTAPGSQTPRDRGLASEDVAFRTRDGVRLSAWYLPAANHRAVVTVPGSGSDRTATLGQAAVLNHHGYGVLMVDPRGQGRSGGQAMDAGWSGDEDLSAAVGFLQQRAGIDPSRIGVLGLSMGGEEAIGVAAAEHAVRAVVAEGATHRTAADKAGYLPTGVAGTIQRGLDWLTYRTAALLSPARQPGTLHDAIARTCCARFLLIAAGDGVDESEAAAYLASAAPARVTTWTVRGATHTHGLTTAPHRWTERVIGFLDRALEVRADRDAGP